MLYNISYYVIRGVRQGVNRLATVTILGLTLIVVGLNWSRFARDRGESALSRESTGTWVQLGRGFPEAGSARQFNDDSLLCDVIKLTNASISLGTEKICVEPTTIESGQRIDLIVQGGEIQSISYSWMSATQRVALGIPLHPDRMSQKDWEFLPGVGSKMAVRIEENRQKNGDFGSFSELQRIKGVGVRKMAVWQEFF